MTVDPFRTASDALSESGGSIAELARPFVRFLPVSGASISTFGSLLGTETISATDARARRVDELQFDLGEGPCWDALAIRAPVIEPDFATSASWPAFTSAIRRENVAAIFAFPLVLGPLEIGALDLYSTTPGTLTARQQKQTQELSEIVSRVLLRHSIAGNGPAEPAAFSRRVIHQATGMVLAQTGSNAEDAYLLIQARAFSDDRPMRDVAEDIVQRRIRFGTLHGADGVTS